jgi:hypothetical protein
MIFYQLNERMFSRRWRRGKNYTENDLRHLARRYRVRLEMIEDGIRITKAGQPVATFRSVVVEENKPEPEERVRVYSALKNPVVAQPVKIK